MLKGKHILLGVTGSIAAYKAAHLIRLLVKHGAEVKVIMTPLAKEFISLLTLATLSKSPILVDFFDPENGQWNSHIDLGIWADLYLVAPATANTIAKMAYGIADNLLLTTYLSARCPVMIAPAMDVDMFLHPTTQENIQKLKSSGNIIIEPREGQLASGLEGKGRMEEPEIIVEKIIQHFTAPATLQGLKVLVTAGPTYEPIDPVRFIGNFSSGKMGYAIANELANRGAAVTLISGPVSLKSESANIELVPVTTAQQMYDMALKYFPQCQAAILAAAVADYRPKHAVSQKIKRTDDSLTLELEPNPDIAAELGKRKQNQILVGFALETDNHIDNARKKLQAKNFDFIVLNPANEPHAGFMSDTNRITIIDKHEKVETFATKSKQEVAKDIVDRLEKLLKP
ncbi:MAG TPA: bifunctional phosphopantothenoylcysteine decarboxylase/phosphopantothenate--cysteine ligase CoaBC [Bacteroidales bacterium]|mgnify:CR=1 FL=1|nr:bifunctional phosphopantothenoylcysteine decarboxylase/phosphopantothenate--cysteine ligase CoaBC [Bacteroidales bacterium]HPO66373.1 bifunctional phosphopantothenoylcysteine decarboxylase/phosphopantothenate--cysteine ligase CoaBC [Bacteroidales bacterium]